MLKTQLTCAINIIWITYKDRIEDKMRGVKSQKNLLKWNSAYDISMDSAFLQSHVYLSEKLSARSTKAFVNNVDSFRLFAAVTAYAERANITTDVIVDVIDSNDNCPKFVDRLRDQCYAEIQVIQGQPSGSIVAILSAADPDADENGDITYAFINGDFIVFFTCHPNH
jgi:hypothetical protein